MRKLLLFFCCCHSLLFAQTGARPQRYEVNFTATPVVIDGGIDDAWVQAPWSADFVDIRGSGQPQPAYRTRIKMLWDKQYLYLLAELEEPHVWATLTKHDAIVFHDNDFELFIDPNKDGQQYFEIEVNALNTLFELVMDKPYNKGGNMDSSWNADGLKSAVKINGTLNNPADRDEGWLVEMAIPFSALERPGRVHQPQPGEYWRMNFSRVQWDTDIARGKYVIRKDARGRKLPEHNWVWSPQGVINMHIPEKWGYIYFKPAK